MKWEELTIAVVGGDEREQEISRLAAETGAEVRAFGFPWPDGGIQKVHPATEVAAALRGARYALFPIPGLSLDGSLYAPSAPAPIVPDERPHGEGHQGCPALRGQSIRTAKTLVHGESIGRRGEQPRRVEHVAFVRGQISARHDAFEACVPPACQRVVTAVGPPPCVVEGAEERWTVAA